jgi:protease II
MALTTVCQIFHHPATAEQHPFTVLKGTALTDDITFFAYEKDFHTSAFYGIPIKNLYIYQHGFFQEF